MRHRKLSHLAVLGVVLAVGSAGAVTPQVAASPGPESETQSAEADLSVTDLEVNYLSEPMGIDGDQPFFGWLTDSNVIATDNWGLQKIVANVYQDGELVKSTQSAVDGAKSASHTATVDLPDGEYTVRYNAHDQAGNVSETATFGFVIDATAPRPLSLGAPEGANTLVVHDVAGNTSTVEFTLN